jgi:hypothetical protein
MRSIFLALIAASAVAQPAATNLKLHAELTSPVSTASAKVSDEVRFKLLEDVKGPDKSVVIPRDAKLTGHVAFVQKRGGESAQAAVSIVIDKAEWKDQSLALDARVVTVETFGLDLMGQRVGNPEEPTRSPGMEQPPWVTAGTSGNTVARGSLPVPKDCGMETDKEIGSVIVCDQQQVQLGMGARMTLRQGK